MFETLDLVDAVLLFSKGHRITRIQANSSRLLVFEFDLSAQQASHLLNSPEASVCRDFHRAWRQVRRQMDAVQLQGRRP